MKAWQFFFLLCTMAVSPHVPWEPALLAGAIYLVIACATFYWGES